MRGGGAPLLVAALLGIAALGVARTQPRLAKIVHDVKQRDDVYVLPPPNELRAMTLGYHAAAVDLLWAKLLVDYGTHWQEHRAFDASRIMDGILAIEPTYAPVYKFADTLLVYKPPRGYAEDARKARAYLERGTRERPGDYEVWQTYGQFLAFLGPSFLDSPEEREQWRVDGANALAHAVELGANPERTLAAATILSKAGARDAAVRFLSRAQALADDPQTREELGFKLRQLGDMEQAEEMERRARRLEEIWHRDYPFLGFEQLLLLGPPVDPARCAGLEAEGDRRACPRTWGDALAAPR